MDLVWIFRRIKEPKGAEIQSILGFGRRSVGGKSGSKQRHLFFEVPYRYRVNYI